MQVLHIDCYAFTRIRSRLSRSHCISTAGLCVDVFRVFYAESFAIFWAASFCFLSVWDTVSPNASLFSAGCPVPAFVLQPIRLSHSKRTSSTIFLSVNDCSIFHCEFHINVEDCNQVRPYHLVDHIIPFEGLLLDLRYFQWHAWLRCVPRRHCGHWFWDVCYMVHKSCCTELVHMLMRSAMR